MSQSMGNTLPTTRMLENKKGYSCCGDEWSTPPLHSVGSHGAQAATWSLCLLWQQQHPDGGTILSPLVQLVPVMGIFSPSFCDWCMLWVYSLPPCAIGACYGYILSHLLRLVPVTGIFSSPLCDWCPR